MLIAELAYNPKIGFYELTKILSISVTDAVLTFFVIDTLDMFQGKIPGSC